MVSGAGAGVSKLATTQTVTENKKNQAAKVRKFMEPNEWSKLPGVRESLLNSSTNRTNATVRPETKVAIAPWLLMRLEKMPSKNTAVIGGAM